MTTSGPRRRLGLLGPIIVGLGATLAGLGIWWYVTHRPAPGAEIDRVALDPVTSLVVREERSSDRAFVELVRNDKLVWRALVPPYAGRRGASGVAWNADVVTIRVMRDQRAQLFALAIRDAAKLASIKLAPDHGPAVKATHGPSAHRSRALVRVRLRDRESDAPSSGTMWCAGPRRVTPCGNTSSAPSRCTPRARQQRDLDPAGHPCQTFRTADGVEKRRRSWRDRDGNLPGRLARSGRFRRYTLDDVCRPVVHRRLEPPARARHRRGSAARPALDADDRAAGPDPARPEHQRDRALRSRIVGPLPEPRADVPELLLARVARGRGRRVPSSSA